MGDAPELMGSQPSASTPAWRDADERLLASLTDERAMHSLWRSDAPAKARPLPRRAAVLARAARELPGGADAVERAARGEPRALAALLRGPLQGWSGQLLHATASYFARLAETFEHDHTPQLAARIRSLAAWVALVEERSFLVELTHRIVGRARDPNLEADALLVAERTIEEWGRIAAQGAKELDGRSAAAVAALARTSDACRMAGVSATCGERYAKRADRVRAHAIDEALASLEDAIIEARVQGVRAAEAATHFQRIHRVWTWCDRDEAVERFAVEQVTALAWDIQQKSDWGELRILLAPCEALYDSFELRLLARPTDIAYAAKCAQILVFRSEAELDRNKEWLLAERAVKVCPVHRNGRLILAHLLSDRAIVTLDRATYFSARADLASAGELVARAELLFPQGQRTRDARTKLDAAKQRWGAPAA